MTDEEIARVATSVTYDMAHNEATYELCKSVRAKLESSGVTREQFEQFSYEAFVALDDDHDEEEKHRWALAKTATLMYLIDNV